MYIYIYIYTLLLLHLYPDNTLSKLTPILYYARSISMETNVLKLLIIAEDGINKRKYEVVLEKVQRMCLGY